MKKIKIIGAGLAGCEAALQLAKDNYQIYLYEMRPKIQTPAHNTALFAELVCSNSLKSKLITTSSGLLKEEMKLLDCELLKIAELANVPAGNSLSVDRLFFSELITEKIKKTPNITFINEEYIQFDNHETILAAGPLISDQLTANLIKIIGDHHLFFFDAIAPVVSADSLDYTLLFWQSRYNKGEPDYLNCPFNKEEYQLFVKALVAGKKHVAKEFENAFFQNLKYQFYENCIPIEELALRGPDTLRFGVMKPIGLSNPHNYQKPYAVIQLRKENNENTAYNLVGCQTMLQYSEQKRIFSLIPGLNNAEFLRFGSIHRNTYLNTPQITNHDFSLIKAPNIRLAGQIAGVEGYTESIYSGLLTAGLMTGRIKNLPQETITGQLWRYLTTPQQNFKPMNANFGLLPEILMGKKNKKEKKELLAQRSLAAIQQFIN